MKTLSTYLLPLCASLLACSSSDDGAASNDQDTGVAVDSSPTDTHVVVDSTHDAPASEVDGGPDAVTDGTEAEVGADADDAIVDDVALDGPKPCDAVVGDCPSGQYCDAVACGHGTCKPAPTSPSVSLDPVCGCDGVAYWNAEQAQNLGKSYAPGVCDGLAATTRHCGGSIGGACPGLDRCIADHSETGTCPAPTVGSTCWYVPSSAACGAGDPKTYRDCGDSACHSYCEVLLGGDAFYSDATCP